MKKEEKAIKYFRDNFNCSQSVLAAFKTESGLSEDDCLKISCAFGGGMARQQFTCGAVTGAMMVLGIKYGRALNDPEEKKGFTYLKTTEFFNEFRKLNGSINCREILNGLDMNNPEDHKKIIDQKLFDIKCEKCITDAVNIVEAIIK
jgi:C_GCAxxG_C_C family probable redox protein